MWIGCIFRLESTAIGVIFYLAVTLTYHQSFPPPLTDPLKRLHVYDGLMMNTRRWLTADAYHRRRQNLQYQSISQPGVVCGLGVRVIEPPESVDARFRDQRWIEIQPGIAIDLEGNPIVVDPSPDRRFRIEARPASGKSLTVYVVVSYFEPLSAQQSDETVREWFRFNQITTPPDGTQIELCRIELKEPVRLKQPIDVLYPQRNELDFRYRLQAKARPHAVVRAAQLKPSQGFDESSDLATYTLYQSSLKNLTELVRSVASLYPSLQGDPEVQQVSPLMNLDDHHLLYLPDGQVLNQFSTQELTALRQYLQKGGGLLIETPPDSLQSLEQIKQRLQQITPAAQTSALERWEDLAPDHALRRSPFLFGLLPQIQGNSIQLYSSGSVVLVEGRLSPAWGLAEGLLLPRSEIRTAQEFGINILHLIWQRQQFTDLLQWGSGSDGGRSDGGESS
jgi:hypothetical protein